MRPLLLNARATSYAALLLALICSISACAKRTRDLNASKANNKQSAQSSESNSRSTAESHAKLININTASATELETLPGIGKALAERIVEHRTKFGPFRKPEHLITVRGISDRRFRVLRDLISVE